MHSSADLGGKLFAMADRSAGAGQGGSGGKKKGKGSRAGAGEKRRGKEKKSEEKREGGWVVCINGISDRLWRSLMSIFATASSGRPHFAVRMVNFLVVLTGEKVYILIRPSCKTRTNFPLYIDS